MLSIFFHQNQLHSLQEYVNDLSSKNDMLLETVEELEREASERVTLVEAKLQATLEVKIYMIDLVKSLLVSILL